jgi:cytochrome c553
VTSQRLLPWERLLWSGRPWRISRRLSGERYLLTDFRLIHITRGHSADLALDDVRDVHRTESAADRLLGTSTIVVHRAALGAPPIVLTAIRRGGQLAALLELLAGDPRAPREEDAVRSALAWEPRQPALDLRGALAGFLGVLIAIFAVGIGLHGKTVAVTYAPDDAIEPNGEKRSRADIVRFMETDVMPWARATFGRLEGGADRVTCGTCHGVDAEARGWRMPAVAALPQPDVRGRAWEIYRTNIDAQMRNAIYGYLAESDNQAKAAYMREVVVPGMSHLLGRPSYDFTQSYEYNRSRHALGCYHCHQVQ